MQRHKPALAATILLLATLPAVVSARKFYDDDPLWKLPDPMAAATVESRDLSDFYDYFLYTFASPAEKHQDAETGRTEDRVTLTLPEGVRRTATRVGLADGVVVVGFGEVSVVLAVPGGEG